MYSWRPSEPASGMHINERVMLAQKHSHLELAKEGVKDKHSKTCTLCSQDAFASTSKGLFQSENA